VTFVSKGYIRLPVTGPGRIGVPARFSGSSLRQDRHEEGLVNIRSRRTGTFVLCLIVASQLVAAPSRVVELTVGDATLELTPGEVAGIVEQLVSQGEG
jgi:hypothetical protein